MARLSNHSTFEQQRLCQIYVQRFAAQFDHLKRTWTSIATEAKCDPKLLRRLKRSNSISPRLYVLNKTHKMPSWKTLSLRLKCARETLHSLRIDILASIEANDSVYSLPMAHLLYVSTCRPKDLEVEKSGVSGSLVNGHGSMTSSK
ncbi:unnamed protein product [Nippostrongylus brasiliensis]|uniref:Uncharacterized protein n=1 Tax=Nippostrongylus brasiliensis TaxID=27835 RepID=A0A0N4YI72_NIPBR|nr:unnamed protein product [Nippostrongylus brasiliensis]